MAIQDQLEEDLALCLRCALLGSCSPALLEELLTQKPPLRERFPAGAVVYEPTRFRRCLGLVLEGQLQVTKGELTVSQLLPGDLFGAAALYSDAPEFAATITARRDSRCLLLPYRVVDELVARESAFRERYLRYLTGRIHFLSTRLDSLAQPGAEGRLARYLLTNTDAGGTLTCSSTELARRLGLSRSSLYRAFEVLEGSGLIRRTGKTISVSDPAALECVCG